MKKTLIFCAVATVVALTFSAAYAMAVRHFIPDQTKQGLFGDMFGGLNAFLSGLALVGAIYAIIMQRQELELQREEMKNTRLEFEKQNQLIAEQVRIQQESILTEKIRTKRIQEPAFHWGGISHSDNATHFSVENGGEGISEIRIELEPGSGNAKEVRVENSSFWQKLGSNTVTFIWHPIRDHQNHCRFKIHYRNVSGETEFQRFELLRSHSYPRRTLLSAE